MRGKQYIPPQIANKRAERLIRDPRMLPAGTLTYRQREVLQPLTGGRAMKEAASELKVATRTIAFHKYRIMEKHGIRTNAELLRFAIQQQVLQLCPKIHEEKSALRSGTSSS